MAVCGPGTTNRGWRVHVLTTYLGHGLRIASEIDLPLQVTAHDRGSVDIRIVRGEDREIADDEQPDETLAELRDDHRKVHYRFSRDDHRTVLRYPGLCEFVADRGLGRIVAHAAPGVDAGYLSVLASGAVLAVHLALNGNLVLHASAVRLDTTALAFVGASGMGKSTMATLMCAGGVELVSDDVLRVAPATAGRPVTVYSGGVESRLRDKASSLAALMADDTYRRTADGRLAIRPLTYAGKPLELAACVVPMPSREATCVTARRLTEGAALRRLLQFPRIVGWTESRCLAHDFEALADLVSEVAVFEVVVPWGPPFRDGIWREVLSEIGIGLPRPTAGPMAVTREGA